MPVEQEHKEEAKDTKKKKGGEEEEQTQGPALTVNIMKYSMDEEMLPDRMLDIEDDKVQSLQESTGLLYPDDNSVMRVDHFSIGGQQFSKSVIIKDNLKFGLRQRDMSQDEDQDATAADPEGYNSADDEDDVDNGLVAYKQTGDSEFWLHFENGSKLAVEQVQIKRNPQKTIRVDPPLPTAEDIAAKEEAIKAYQAAVQKA